MFNRLRNLWRGARTLLAALIEPNITSGYLKSFPPRHIINGIDYRLPPSVSLSQMGTTGNVMQYLKKNAPEWSRELELMEASTVFRHQFDTPYQTGQAWQMLSISTPLREWDYSTRRDVLERTHLVWERDPLANSAVSYNRLFSVQKGMTVSYQNQEVREVLERFINHPENQIKKLEKDLLDSLQVDGEVFLRFFVGDGLMGEEGEVVVAALPPWGIRNIKHEPGFINRVENYHYVIQQDDGYVGVETTDDWIDAEDVVHARINSLPYEQRGRPELFRIIPWLRAYSEWLEDRARQNRWRNALIFDVTLTNATQNQVSAKAAQYREPPDPGSIWVHNDKEKIEPITNNVAASEASEDGRQIKLMNAIGMRLPEYFLADGSNANLASATAQQLPALRSFEEFQDIMIEQLWTPTFKKVVRIAVDAGLVPDEVPVQDEDGEAIEGEMIAAEDAFSLSYPPLERDDPKTVVEALVMASSQDWVSDQTATGILPWQVDYRMEQKQIDAERQKLMDDMVQGKLPFPPPFGMNGGQEEEPEEEPAQ